MHSPENLEKLFLGNKFEKEHLENRRIFFWGPVEDSSAKPIVDKLIYLNSLDSEKPIYFYINSPGGVVTSGMVIYDTIKLIQAPVYTICTGLAASMGSILLSVGAKRFIFPHGRVMIHQPSIGRLYGTAADIEITARELIKVKELSARILAENCNQPYEKVLKDFDRDYWMNAEESKEYGIVDEIITELL